MTRGYEPRWDHDRVYGEQGERVVESLRELGLAGRIETKRKRYADDEFYIELQQDPGRRGAFKPSGLNTTEAEYWAYVINSSGIVVFIPVVLLRDALRAGRGTRAEEDHGDNPTRGRLIGLNSLLVHALVIEAA